MYLDIYEPDEKNCDDAGSAVDAADSAFINLDEIGWKTKLLSAFDLPVMIETGKFVNHYLFPDRNSPLEGLETNFNCCL